MSESLDRRSLPPDNPEAIKQNESQRQSEKYLKLAQENPHTLTEEIKKNPKTEPLLRKLLWDTEYERVRDLNPIKLSEDEWVAKMQKEIYAFVDIHPETDRNGTKEKFIKGIIDSIIIENSELAMKIIETKWVILKDMIAQIFSSEWLRQILEALWVTLNGFISWDAYKFWKSFGEIGLITVWSGAWGFVLKRVWKWAIQAGERVAVNAGKNTVLSGWLQIGWRATEWVGKVLQSPYNAVEAGVKKVWWVIKDGVKAGNEAIWNIPQVQKVTKPARRVVSEWMERLSDGAQKVITATKERAKEALAIASVPILVWSKDGVEASSRLKGQIGAVGDIEKINHWVPEKIIVRSLADFPPEIKKYIDIPSEELYADKRFKDLIHYKNELGELSSERILGYGNNAIIVTDPTNPNLVLKIAQERSEFHWNWPADKLDGEVVNHSRVAQIMPEWYKSSPDAINIRIPFILQESTLAWKQVLQMTKVEWQSYHTLTVIDRVSKQRGFDMTDLEWIKQMNDFQVREFLDRKYNANFQSIIENYGNDLIDKVRDYRNMSASDIGRFEKFLSSQNPPISIKDPNGGNYMLWRDGNYYIIDFARTK